jgi:phosphoenolpyruvate carboxylase
VLHQCLVNPALSVKAALDEAGALTSSDELFAPLQLLYESLVATDDESTANNLLLDVLRQVRCFGLALVRLDVRQESSRHAEVVDAITTHLGLGSYLEWDEAQRLQFLVAELEGRRPLLPPGMDVSADVREVIATFRTLAELPADSLGAYVIR